MKKWKILFLLIFLIPTISAKEVIKKEVTVYIRCNDSELAQYNQATATIELRAGPNYQSGGTNLWAQCYVDKGGQLGQCKYGPYTRLVASSTEMGNKYYQSMEFYDYLLSRAGLSISGDRTWEKYYEKTVALYNKMNNNQFRLTYTLNMNSMDLIIDDNRLYYDKYCTAVSINYSDIRVIEPDPPPVVERPTVYDTCDDLSVDRIKACGCIPAGIADLTSKAYFILQIIGPVLLLILGGFEMAKAVSTQDESAIEKAKKKLVNKFIAAAAIFFVFTIMQFMVNLLAKNAEGIIECVDILLNGYVI